MSVGVPAVFLGALVTALATGLGALPFALVKRPPEAWLGIASAAAVGFMAAASLALVVEGARYDGARTGIGAIAGVAIIGAVTAALRNRKPDFGALRGADALKALVIVAVMTAHSAAEGVGVGVSYGGGNALGLFVTLAIAVHNIPEGLAISLVLVPRGTSVRTAAGWSIFSSLPQPLLAVPAFIFVEHVRGVLPLGLGFAAGAMCWLAVTELVPDARTAGTRAALVSGGTAFAAMIVLQAVLLPF